MEQNEDKWTTIIQPRTKWGDIDLQSLWNSKDLISLFVHRDFVSMYKQTILGPVWFFFQPLMTTVVFTIIFGKVAKIPTDGVPPFLFYMSGIIPWAYFSTCLEKTANTFVANAGIFGKVYFPRLAVPISNVISALLTFGIQFLTFLSFSVYYLITGAKVLPNLFILLTPVLLLQISVLAMGIGLTISALTTRYKDLSFTVGFGIQLLMYSTPIVYPLAEVEEKWRWFFMLNPMSAIIETFRYAYLGAGSFPGDYLLISAFMTCVLFMLGIVLFSKAEKSFMDTI
jgi:lipopolysaccharide transport system permease protein